MFLIQHGWGGGSLIPQALRAGLANGVVFGAGDEAMDALGPHIAGLREEFAECQVLVDPQFYVLALPDPNTKKLPSYPYGNVLLGPRDFTVRRIPVMVREVLASQIRLGASALLSPTVALRGFADKWNQIALILAQETIEQAKELGGARVYVSVLLTEDSLLQWEELNGFLDELTTLDCHGFYLILARNSGANLNLEGEKLGNLLQAVHSLSILNGYEVIVGYAGLMSVPLRAAGAHATAAGWFDTTRLLSLSRWDKERGGGRQPLLKYTSDALMNRIYVETDLPEVARMGLLEQVLGPSPYAASLREGEWSLELDRLQYFAACHALDRALGTSDSIGAAVDLIRCAEGLYRDLGSALLQPGSGGRHLASWRVQLQRLAGA